MVTAENEQERLVRRQVQEREFRPVRTELRGKLPIRACPGGSRFLHYPRMPLSELLPIRVCPGGSLVCTLAQGRFVGKPAFLWGKPRGDDAVECVW